MIRKKNSNIYMETYRSRRGIINFDLDMSKFGIFIDTWSGVYQNISDIEAKRAFTKELNQLKLTNKLNKNFNKAFKIVIAEKNMKEFEIFKANIIKDYNLTLIQYKIFQDSEKNFINQLLFLGWDTKYNFISNKIWNLDAKTIDGLFKEQDNIINLKNDEFYKNEDNNSIDFSDIELISHSEKYDLLTTDFDKNNKTTEYKVVIDEKQLLRKDVNEILKYIDRVFEKINSCEKNLIATQSHLSTINKLFLCCLLFYVVLLLCFIIFIFSNGVTL